ncbi:hypothetical protein H2198_002375 [Neophaeococcomyces mojaviensis]|uniref:Uncharacterized protein n=1 Tax=Neophaeococcomyces mojaviensis TaxID=3383035 RepID=A0ACC3AES0_9EURO|nr:hypothetical protein H2198_002375 [Knufia sp. JES_112]
MASYLSSYFGSGAGNTQAPQYQQQYQTPQPTQSSSTWAGTFSSRLAGLRTALTRDNEEDDPDNEDCSHVSNVLRAYYIEKGRPFPEWLPPDPRKPAVTPAAQPPPLGQYGNVYPNQYGNNAGMPHSRGNSVGRGGLSDLWDSGPAQTAPQAQSLRAPRPTPQSLRSSDSGGRQDSSEPTASHARPLPSQRVGSYQNVQPAQTPPPVVGSRDRLRARLQGSNSGRSSPANTSQGSYTSQGGYDRQYSSGGGSPHLSASQPWANDSNQYGASGGYDAPTSGYGNQSHQQRSGGYGR